MRQLYEATVLVIDRNFNRVRVPITYTINWHSLHHQMAVKVLRNSSGTARFLDGAIKAKRAVNTNDVLVEALKGLLAEVHDVERNDEVIAAVAKARAALAKVKGERQ